jgi:CheY-like chemotaxis protein
MKQITVLLADDNGVVRTEFRRILELEDDLEVVGEAKNGHLAVAMVKKTSSRISFDGRCNAAAQWFASHSPDSQSRPGHQSTHAFGAQ